MLLDANQFDSAQILHADVCIVGAGVAGLVLAHELMSTGRKIVVVDAGGLAYSTESQDFYKAGKLPDSFPDTSVTRLRMLGGSSNHWENSTERFDPIDFERRDWVPDSGWPFSYDELNAHYRQAESYCGVGTDGYDFDFWAGLAESEDISQGSKDTETAIAKSALPPTQFYAKLSATLEAAENVTIVSNANIVDMRYSRVEAVVNALQFKSKLEEKHEIRAGTFCLCAGGIENARLMLAFNETFENTLGNLDDNVGRYFMEHPVLRAAHFYPLNCARLPVAFNGFVNQNRYVRYRLKITEAALKKHRTNNLRLYLIPQGELVMSHGVASSHVLKDSLQSGEWPSQFGQHLVNVLTDLDSIVASLRKGAGSYQASAGPDFAGYQVISMIEQTPDRNNRVRLGDVRDAHGSKRIEIDWRVSQLDRDLAWKTLQLLSTDRALNRRGRFRLLHERESRIWGSQMGFSAHHMGTTRMSDSKKLGVVDADCRVFGVKNLYISGSSTFPTGGHVPPTLTIVAMAIRLARKLEREVS